MPFRKTKLFVIVAVFSFINPLLHVTGSPSLSADEVWNKLNSETPPLIIDVRSQLEYIESHIPTSINIPIGTNGINQSLIDMIQGYNKNEIIAVCSCPEGSNAKVFADDLLSNGFDNVYYMIDNYRFWPYTAVSGSLPGELNMNSISTDDINPSSPPDDLSPLLLINIILVGILVFQYVIKPRIKQ
ncbi:MAG: rhodanese-like domain-containing protein [Candidatus Thorarchaeota archaeon]